MRIFIVVIVLVTIVRGDGEYPKGDANRKIASRSESEVGQKCFESSPLERLRLLADLYASLDDAKLKTLQYNVDVIDLAPDDWITVVNAIELLEARRRKRRNMAT